MTRITTLFLLLMFWCGSAFAIVYQCRTGDGNLFLTNNRNKFPPGCVQVGEPIGEAPAPSPPDAVPTGAQGREPEMNERRRSSTPPPSQAPPEPREMTTPEAPSPEADVVAPEVEIPPAELPETGSGGANPVPLNELEPPPVDSADEGRGEVTDAPGEPAPDGAGSPADGGEVPAGAGADAAGEGNEER